eukprot:12577385-Ditylum_brightwellii.AAC.1
MEWPENHQAVPMALYCFPLHSILPQEQKLPAIPQDIRHQEIQQVFNHSSSPHNISPKTHQ